MRSTLARIVALAFVATAAPAAAQAPAAAAPSDAKAPQQPPAQPGTKLNLKLDNPAQYSRETPRDGGAEVLPALGSNARPIPIEQAPPRSGARTSPYPPDTNPGR
jgi:hypothetical protein